MYKTRLQELCYRYRWKYPEYVETMDGPPHLRLFQARVIVNGQSFDSHDQFKTKRAAQNEAARMAFEHFSSPEFAPPEDALISRKKGLSWVGTAKKPNHEFKEIEYTFSGPSSVDLAYLQEHVQPELPATHVEEAKEFQGNPDYMIHTSFDFYKSDTYIAPGVGNTSSSSTSDIVYPANLLREDITMVKSVGEHPNYVPPPQSTTKSEEKKPFIAVDSNLSSASAVRKSIDALDPTKNEKSAEAPRRKSLSSKSTTSLVTKPTASPKSETRARSPNSQGKSKATASDSSRSSTSRKKFNLLSSPSYWLSHIKLSESASKHSISLGFFKLALEAECEPIQVLKDAAISYANRHDLGEPMKEVLRLYNVPKFSGSTGAGMSNLKRSNK
ncbi:hypothetical protein HS088_TW04G01121 [Tripterygium wilfordii]|uniref:DRBM domain-containing protein n=1 Tax=Tripterygium wilfordii TaxID=458696 RepID=A0A7J7DS09_TRIWF|nr:uncharacterized protein LOC119996877 [Tripterygium wilfordii]KAF5749158.1 hypothetical protein HS088_TW04G01121 [Tripterygium wilfordii]